MLKKCNQHQKCGSTECMHPKSHELTDKCGPGFCRWADNTFCQDDVEGSIRKIVYDIDICDNDMVLALVSLFQEAGNPQ